jgi:hypothetical protein
MAHPARESDVPEHSAVFERPPARSLGDTAERTVVVASACRTTREVVAWAVATELGLRCLVTSSSRETLIRLARRADGEPDPGQPGGIIELPRAVLLEPSLLLEPTAGPALCRVLHDLAMPTFILRVGTSRDLCAAERAAAGVLDSLEAAMERLG